MADEPECKPVPIDVLRERYELLRKVDPYHPCIILNNSVAGLLTYAKVADVMWPDPYPMYLRGGTTARPMTRISLFVDKGYEASNRRKPVWVCPEAFDWGFTSGRAERVPATFAQQRCQTWLAINHGAKGVIYFQAQYSRNAPGLALGTPYLAREVERLKPVLLYGERRLIATAPCDGMDAAAWQHEGETYVVGVNYTNAPIEVEIDVGAPVHGTRHVFAEGRRVQAVGGKIRDLFAPYATHVYTTSPSDGDFPTLAEVDQQIAAFKAGLHKEGNLAFGGKVTVSDARLQRRAGHRRVVDGVYYPRADDWVSIGWQSSSRRLPAWCEVDLGQVRQIAKVVVMCDAGAKQYDVQCRVGDEWRTLGTVGSVTERVNALTFRPVHTERIRVLVKAAERSFTITEIEAYGDVDP